MHDPGGSSSTRCGPARAARSLLGLRPRDRRARSLRRAGIDVRVVA